MRVFVGMSLDIDKVAGALFDVYGKKLDTIEIERRQNLDLEDFYDEAIAVVEKFASTEIFELQAIGLAINEDEFNADELEKLPIVTRLRAKFNCGIIVNTKTNCSIFGVYKNAEIFDKNVISMFVGDEAGGALIVDGKLFSNRTDIANLGHMVVVHDGAPCKCGNYGCLEAYASKHAIQQYIAQQHKKGRLSMVGESAARKRPMMMKSIGSAYIKGDAVTIEAVDRALGYIALAFCNALNTLRPEAAVFGGELFSIFGEEALIKIKQYALMYSNVKLVGDTKFQLSNIGALSAIYGAYQLALSADIGCI